MKKLYFILLLLTAFANAQIVNIPDANFKARLIAGYDGNQDGEIQESEALMVNTLDVRDSNISDLTGIRSCSNLVNLNCSGNNLTSLDVSGLSLMYDLYCGNNQLTSLNLTGANSIITLSCSFNNLTSLSINDLPGLGFLDCTNNMFTTLNLTNPQVRNISCGNNSDLTSLSVSGSPTLTELDCRNNPVMTDLNFTNCPRMFNLYCSNTLISSLDFTGTGTFMPGSLHAWCDNNRITDIFIPDNVVISDLEAANNLIVDFDISHGGKILSNCHLQGNPLQTVNFKNGYLNSPSNIVLASQGNTLLRYLCVDDNELAGWQAAAQQQNFSNLVINSYCSYTPGGGYNTITGTVAFDANGNGCDASDFTRPNIRVNINNGASTGATFTNTNGNYTYYTPTGNFTVTPDNQNISWFNFSPATAVIPFANSNNNTVTQNFCLTANGIHPDLEVTIVPMSGARPGFDSDYKIIYNNKGNQTLTGTVAFAYEDAVSDFVSSSVVPNLQSTGLLTYNFTDLQPFESRSFTIKLNLNTPMETPALNDGDVVHFTATVSPVANDEMPSDNTFQFNQVLINSFDPNDIVCVEGNRVSPSQIGNYLHYIINFENVGSAAAINIVVKDIINTAQFDVSTLQVLNSSANVSTRMTGNVAEFIFEDINLQPQAHGNVSFKIKSKNTLVEGSTVTQSAGIYFDYNFPVITDPANTIFQTLSNPDVAVDASIAIYPNPTKGLITIECNNTIKSVQLYDVQGRILQTNVVNETQASIDISTHSNGIYFIKIISDNGMKVQKIVKE